jgi:hypothetical protein
MNSLEKKLAKIENLEVVSSDFEFLEIDFAEISAADPAAPLEICRFSGSLESLESAAVAHGLWLFAIGDLFVIGAL